jgi:biopolymer transport protein ExbB
MPRATRTLLSIAAVLAMAAVMPLAGADAGDGAPAAKSHTLFDMIIAGGPVEYILIVLSVISYSMALQYTFTLKRETLVPEGIVDEIHQAFADGVTDESVETARNAVAGDTSMLGNIVAAALDKKDFGYEAMREAAEQIGAAEHNKYMSKVGWLSLFASTATLGGLLGTVTGIIGAFLAMGNSTPDPAKLSLSIGEALVCTATGLIIAIGTLMFYFFLRNRVNACALDAAALSNEVLDYFRPSHK